MSESQKEIPEDAVVTPPFCAWHRRDLIVRRLRLSEADPWMATEVTATILLFQAIAGSERIARRMGVKEGEKATQADLALALIDLGCMACFDGEAYRRAVLVLRKGLSHAAQVSQMKASDPDWPYMRGATAGDE